MKRHIALLGLVVALLGSLLAAPMATHAQTGPAVNANSLTNIQLSQIGLPGGRTFTAVLDITDFVVDGDEIQALGTVTGTITNRQGRIIRQTTEQVQIPVTGINVPNGENGENGVCPVLFLQLGPIHLELLGLIVDVSQITVEITADPEGGLLGQLLCALAGGIDAGDPLAEIVGLLNQILGALLNPAQAA